MSKQPNLKIISVTGTKGKTTIVRLIDYILRDTEKTILLVDSDGHYLNGKQKSTNTESVSLRQAASTVCPGKYLYELRHKSGIAIFETAIGSAGRIGLGYLTHDIGILHNVYEDHLGVRVKTQAQLAKDKASLIFGRLSPNNQNSYAIFNINDKLVCKNLDKINTKSQATLVPYGILEEKRYFDLQTQLKNNGKAIIYESSTKKIYIYNNKTKKIILDISKLNWAFNGTYDPINLALCASIAAAASHFDFIYTKTKKNVSRLSLYKLKKSGGRMVILKNIKRNFECILDYAHEKYSLKAVSNFAKKRSKNKTIGIVRFAPDRTNKQLCDYGKSLAKMFDIIIVYDKIDGITRKPLTNKKARWYRAVGEVSNIVFKALKEKKTKNIYKTIKEVEAIQIANDLVEDGDVIVHISNKHEKSMNMVEQILKCK